MRCLAYRLFISALLVLFVTPSAFAQSYPSRPITLIVPYAPGGSVDAVARVIAPRLGERLGQNIIIENVAGAGGVTGTQRAARAEPDGYTLLFSVESTMVKGLQAEGKAKAQVVAVTGVAQQYNVQTRIDAFKGALAKHPGYELVANEDGKWNTALSEKITGELLVRFNARGGVDGVYGMADNQAMGAIRAIESAGLKIGVANTGIVVVASNCMRTIPRRNAR